VTARLRASHHCWSFSLHLAHYATKRGPFFGSCSNLSNPLIYTSLKIKHLKVMPDHLFLFSFFLGPFSFFLGPSELPFLFPLDKLIQDAI